MSIPGLVPFASLSRRSLRTSARQLNVDLILSYNLILTAVVTLLALRRLVQVVRKRFNPNPRSSTISEKCVGLSPTQSTEELTREHERTRLPSRWTRAERHLTAKQLPRPWRSCGLNTPAQALVVLALFALNVAFMLVKTVTFSGAQTASWNHLHVVAHRCGFLSLAQMPLLIAFTGRNGIVAFLTGIDYQQLRFVHKVLALWMAIHAVLHTIDASIASARFTGGSGVFRMYFHNYLGQTGIVMMVGLLCILIFSIRAIRQRWYELFLSMHIIGAILVLVGLMYHVPLLVGWVWAPIGLWALERSARAIRLFTIRFHLRSPLPRASATLVDGGAIILRVPFRGTWTSGQHAYLSFPGLALADAPHPFSVANVPAANEDDSGNEMLFVMGVRNGLTATVAKHLESFSSRSACLRVAVEGPYGSSDCPHRYDEILLIAGGTGITHIASMLADVVQRASLGKKCITTRIKLIWTIQEISQLSWIVNELVDISTRAQEAGVFLSLAIHVTRGSIGSDSGTTTPVPKPTQERQGSVTSIESFGSFDSLYHPQPNYWAPSRRLSGFCESPLDLLLDAGAVASLHRGRPRLSLAIPAFVEGSSGSTLVVVCGPKKLARSVLEHTEKLSSLYPVTTRVASFEC